MSSSRRCTNNIIYNNHGSLASSNPTNTSATNSSIVSGESTATSKTHTIMNSHSKHSSQAAISLYSMRGKSWSCYHKHVINLIDSDHESNIAAAVLSEHRADVQRLDIKDYGLYGISPSDPGPMVICNQCNHIMAPEGILRHVKKVHGSKIVPAASSKMRIASLLASKTNSTATGSYANNSGNSNSRNSSSSSSSAVSASSLSTAFSNRLNVSKMAPPPNSLNLTSGNITQTINDNTNHNTSINASKKINMSNIPNNLDNVHVLLNKDDVLISSVKANHSAPNSTASVVSIGLTNATNATRTSSSISAAATITNGSLSNSNSPTSSTKTSNSVSSAGRRNRKILPIKYREYDPEKHCGVALGNMKPCTRSLTCKTHQISLRRNVDGRSKPFDQLLADHRNNVKDGQQKHSSGGKQANYAASENSNQLIALDSIADSNSSSSFDLERRSFSSNSNQSTLGNYTNEHSALFVTSSTQQQQHSGLNGNHTLPVLTPLSSTATGATQASNFTYPEPTAQNRKHAQNIQSSSSFASSPDDQSNSLSQMADLNGSNSIVQSVLQTGTSLQGNATAATGLTNLADYAVQMNQLNDLINDDNGDCLDMSFWENFDNFTYETDILMTNNNNSSNSSQQNQLSQQQQQSVGKSNVKRTNSFAGGSQDGSVTDRKRKRANETEDDGIAARGNGSYYNSKESSKEQAISRIAAEIAFSSAPYDSKLTNDVNSRTLIDSSMQPAHGKTVYDSVNADTYSTLMAHSYSADAHFQDDGQPKPHLNATIPDVICIDDDDDDTNNNLDATVNRNAGKDMVLVQTPTTPSKATATPSLGHSEESDTKKANAMATSPAQQPLADMALSNAAVVNTIDLPNITKNLSENDHHLSPVSASTLSPHANESSKSSQINQNIPSVPIDETENCLLGIGYKCLRTKGVRMVNPLYAGGSSGSYGSHRGSSNDSNRSREKENSMDSHNVSQLSDDDGLLSIGMTNSSTNASNSLLLPPSQRYSTKIHYSGIPKPVDTNRFGLAKGCGVGQSKHAIDSTKTTQQQIFHRLQSRQHNGTTLARPFANASMIALRNNGSLVRLNNAKIFNSSISSISNAVNNITNGPILVKGGTGNASSSSASTTTSNSNGGKSTGKKTAQIVNSLNTSGNGTNGIVLLNADPTGSMSSLSVPGAGNQTHYAILRRPNNQSIQLLAKQTTTEPTGSFSVMPVLQRVRTRITPTSSKNLQTDQLVKNLTKSLRPRILTSTLLAEKSSAKKLSPIHHQPPASASAIQQTNSNTAQSNSNSASTNSTPSYKSNRSQKHHTMQTNHKSSSSSSSSSNQLPPTSSLNKSIKQNGHMHGNGSATLSQVNVSHLSNNNSSYSLNSLQKNLQNSKSLSSSSVSSSPSYHRSLSSSSTGSHRSASLLLGSVKQMQASPAIESLVLPKIIS